MLAALFAQQVDHVLEILDVAALVAGNGNALRVFLQGCRDHFLDRAVVAQVDHLAAVRLQDAAHDVDRRIMAVEQRCRRDKAHLVGRTAALLRRLGLRRAAAHIMHIGKVGHGLHRLWVLAATARSAWDAVLCRPGLRCAGCAPRWGWSII
ncbi:hypothetical protein D3C72_1907070 [compost metagenome]